MTAESNRQTVSKIFVTELEDKQVVTSLFLAKNKMLLRDKKGKAYISLLLSDSSGDIDTKIWDNAELMDKVFNTGDIVFVKGLVQLYQNKKQFIVHKIEKFNGEAKISDFLKNTQVVPEKIFSQLMSIVSTIKDPYLHQLIMLTLNDSEIQPLLLVSPAAKTVHHARVGGLIEHIVAICHLANAISPLYPHVNRDLIIFGAIFHDIGKIWELKIDHSGISYTNKGRLIGHLSMGLELIEKKTQAIAGFPEALKDICKHIVLAHHGKYEYGSPKRPKTLEAFIVWMLDDLDSKIDAIGSAMEIKGSEESWSQHSILFDRYFFLKGTQWDS